MGIPLITIYRIASHLVIWGKGMIIEKLNSQSMLGLKSSIILLESFDSNNQNHNQHQPSTNIESVLIINSQTSLQPSELSFEFRTKFPSLDLLHTLKLFQSPQRLKEHLTKLPSAQHRSFLDCVIWLLHHELIVIFSEFLYFLPSLNQSNSSNSLSAIAKEDPSAPFQLFEK